ncbi:MAG: hypothetical protein ABIO02_03660 [Patescibacteria group bacterium]
MPEFRIGKLHFQIGAATKEKSPMLSNEASQWQTKREPLWAEASRDPEVYAIRQPCPNDCGWWTMSVSEPTQPDIANMNITLDTIRHIAHTCQNANQDDKARIGNVPPPSH